MIESRIGPVRGDMTYRAVLRGRQVVVRLAGRIRTVMARLAVVGDACVIEHRRHEGATRNVADVTVLGRRHVVDRGILSYRIDTVVTGIAALAHDIRSTVIHKRANESRRVVADTAIGIGDRVVKRGILAYRTHCRKNYHCHHDTSCSCP